jgi:hypothetical protein
MTLATSGEISLGGSAANRSINLELGLSATAQISLNDTAVRSLAGVPSGAITVPTNFYGKSVFTPGTFTFTTSGTFTLPSGYSTAEIEVWGGGGGGGSYIVNAAANAGTASSVTGTGVSLTSDGGQAGFDASFLGDVASGGAGGTASGGSTNTSGGSGGFGISTGSGGESGSGGDTAAGVNAFTSGGVGGFPVNVSSFSAPGNAGGLPGAGGSGGATYIAGKVNDGQGGGGGGGGGYSRVTAAVATSPAGTVLTITVGTGGAGSSATNTISNGGAGADGRVVIKTA